MAKKDWDVDSLFAPPPPKKNVPPVSEEIPSEPIAAVQAAVVSVEPVREVPKPMPEKTQKEKTSKQVYKQPKEEVRKQTFEIPVDVWNDFDLLISLLKNQGIKKTKNAFVTELMQAAINKNKALIERFKKM